MGGWAGVGVGGGEVVAVVGRYVGAENLVPAHPSV